MNERVAELCRRLKPLLGRQIDTLWAIYLSDTTAEGRAEIEHTLELLAAQHLGSSYQPDRSPFPPPPETFARAGDVHLGQVHYAGRELYPFRLPADRLKEHLLICGRSGSGKTTLTFHLMRGLMDRGIKVLALDFKRSYRQLLQARPDLRVYTIGRDLSPLRFNPLIPPPGTEPGLWAKQIIEVIARGYLGGEGVISLLRAGLDHLYRELGVYDREPERWPTFADLLAWLRGRKLTGRAAMWKASAERILTSLAAYGEFARILDAQDNTHVQNLLDHHAVFEMDGLASSSDRSFFSEALTLYLYRTKLARGPSRTLTNMIVLEEAHHLLLAREAGAQESVLENALRMTREYGLGFAIVDQSPSMLSRTACANTYCTVALSQRLSADIRTMAGAMSLSSEQSDALKSLPVGQAVVRLADQHPEPFLVQVPPSDLEDDAVDDEKVRRSVPPHEPHRDEHGHFRGRFQSDPTDPGAIPPSQAPSPAVTPLPAADKREENTSGITTSSHPPANEPTDTPRPPPPDMEADPAEPEPSRAPAPELSREAVRFLADVIRHRLSTTVQRYDRLHLSRRRGNAIRQQLTQAGLIDAVRLPTRSGQVVLHELTDAGRSLCDRLGLDPGPPPPTSLEHAFWAHRTAEHLEQDGYRVWPEQPVDGNGTVDLLAERQGERLAVEIETGKSDIPANLTKLAGKGFTKLIVVATNPNAVTACQKAIRDLGPEPPVAMELWTWLEVS